MTLKQAIDKFVECVRREMADNPYPTLWTDLVYFQTEYDLDPKLLGRLLRGCKKSLKAAMPEFELEYKPDWDFTLVIRRETELRND